MIPKFKIGDEVSADGFKGLVRAIELDTMITAGVQPYYVIQMEFGKEILPENSLKLRGIFNAIKRTILEFFV